MRGGLVFFRGAGAAARAYLESDHSHADEYYLADAGAVAAWKAWDGQGVETSAATLDGASYQAWVDWKDPKSGLLRGTPREETRISRSGEIVVNPASPRFVEMTINCDKSLSVAAALDPAVSAALDDAQAAAGEAMNRYMAQNSVTRVGPRGEQRLVPVERIESVAVVHRSSRAGDPHRHVHMQWGTRVFAEGQWRGLHTAATLKQQGALRGVGEATINSDARLHAALADAGFTFDAATGRVTNLDEHARVMSKRANQIEANRARFEREWRTAHPGQEPDAAALREWDQKAWAFERPRKRQATENAEQKWVRELREEGLQVDAFAPVARPAAVTLDQLDRAAIAEHVVMVAGSKASAWSVADLEGHVGVLVGQTSVRATPEEVTVFARTVAAQVAANLPQLHMDVPGQVPGWVRHLTSERVQRIEEELRASLTDRAMASGLIIDTDAPALTGLNAEQSTAARALSTRAPLIVIEGAAGSGKTTMLAAARDLGQAEGLRFVVLAPTLRAANEAASSIGAHASSVHKLVHEHGFRWDDDGRWTRLAVGEVDPATGAIYEGPSAEYRVDADTRVVVDEAGMIDQDLAHALVTVANENAAPLAMIGDRAQLPAIGRGGVLDMAVAVHPRPLDLTELHRFREAGYADLTLRMRDRVEPRALFEQLHERGNLVVHETPEKAWEAITADVSRRAAAGASVAVAVATNDQAAELNALVQAAHADAGRTRTPGVEVAGSDALTLRVGDRLMTRRNNSELGVANRDTWTVDRVHRDGSVSVSEGAKQARLPREYVEQNTHLAYASTEYGVQGATVDYGHGVITDASSAQAVYVAATRGREQNVLHVVAESHVEARDVFAAAMGREAGDRGTDAAREAAQRDVEGITLPEFDHDPQLRAARLAAEERAYQAQLRGWEATRQRWQDKNPEIPIDEYPAAVEAAVSAAADAAEARRALEENLAAEAVRTGESRWANDYAAVAQAEAAADSASVFRRSAAQRNADAARARFQARHRTTPAAAPTAAQRVAWARAATAAGTHAGLDAARAMEQAAIARHARLTASPAPSAAAPTAPRPGTAEQEAKKDRVYAAQQGDAAKRKDRAHEHGPSLQPTRDQAPTAER